jgi:hypothetical protein
LLKQPDNQKPTRETKRRIESGDQKGKGSRRLRFAGEVLERRQELVQRELAKDTILLTFTNHYSRAQNKCFIVVE